MKSEIELKYEYILTLISYSKNKLTFEEAKKIADDKFKKRKKEINKCKE